MRPAKVNVKSKQVKRKEIRIESIVLKTILVYFLRIFD